MVLVVTVSSEAIFLIVARMSWDSFVGVNLFDVRFSFLVIEVGRRGYGRVGSAVCMMMFSSMVVSGGIMVVRAGVVNSSLVSVVRHAGRCVEVSACRLAVLFVVALDQCRRGTMTEILSCTGRQRKGKSTEGKEVEKEGLKSAKTLICFSSLWREPRYCLYLFASVSSRLCVLRNQRPPRGCFAVAACFFTEPTPIAQLQENPGALPGQSPSSWSLASGVHTGLGQGRYQWRGSRVGDCSLLAGVPGSISGLLMVQACIGFPFTGMSTPTKLLRCPATTTDSQQSTGVGLAWPFT